MPDLLERLGPGWTEGPSARGMLASGKPNGGIIDSEIVSGKWFVIFNQDIEPLEGFATREEAIDAFLKTHKE